MTRCLALGLGGGAVRDNLNFGNLLDFSSVLVLVLESSSLDFQCGAGAGAGVGAGVGDGDGDGDGDGSPVARIRSFSMVISRTVVLGLAHKNSCVGASIFGGASYASYV